MINEFKLKLYIPSLDSKEYFSEFKNSYLINLLKYSTNKDYIGLSEYFDFIIHETLYKKEIFYKLDIFDKLIILLQFKAININSEIKFKIKSDNENKLIAFNLFNEIKLLTEKKFLTYKIVEIEKNFSLKLSIPTALYIKNLDDIFNHCIKTIYLQDNEYDFENLDSNLKEKLFENISGTNTHKFLNFFEEVKTSCKEITLLSQNTHIKELNSLEFNPFNNSILYFLDLVYSEDLKNIFELMYVLTSKVKISIPEFLCLIPSESLMLYSLYSKEIQQQNDELEKSTKPAGMPLKTESLS